MKTETHADITLSTFDLLCNKKYQEFMQKFLKESHKEKKSDDPLSVRGQRLGDLLQNRTTTNFLPEPAHVNHY